MNGKFINQGQVYWLSITASGLLILALGEWPYGFYTLLRWIVSISAGYVAAKAHQTDLVSVRNLFIFILILFNPFAPIYLSRSIWQPIDLITAAIFIKTACGFKNKEVRE